MKHKKIISTLLFILCFQFILGFFVVQVGAADAVAEAPGIDFVPSVAIPGASFLKGDCVKPENVGKPCMRILGNFEATKGVISGMYKFGLGIAGILATIMIAFGGITWLSSGGNASQIQRAKQYITGALTGLVLGLLSYTMLYIVNPDIVELKTTKIKTLTLVTEGCSFVATGTCGKDGKSELSTDVTKCGGYPGVKDDGKWECCCQKGVDKMCDKSMLDLDLDGEYTTRTNCGFINIKDSCMGVMCGPGRNGEGICLLETKNGRFMGGKCVKNDIPMKAIFDLEDITGLIEGDNPCGYVKVRNTGIGLDAIDFHAGYICGENQTCVIADNADINLKMDDIIKIRDGFRVWSNNELVTKIDNAICF